MQFDILETERLKLRKITVEILDHVFENYAENELMSFLGLATEEELEKEKEKYQKGFTTFNKKLLYFQLICKESGKIIGWCGYHTWYVPHNRAELGYGLYDDSLQGIGLMSEALHPIIRHGFTEMNLHRIEAFIAPYNIPSLKLVEKLNFVKEGHLRQHYVKDQVAEDSLVFSLLKPEYVDLEVYNLGSIE